MIGCMEKRVCDAMPTVLHFFPRQGRPQLRISANTTGMTTSASTLAEASPPTMGAAIRLIASAPDPGLQTVYNISVTAELPSWRSCSTFLVGGRIVTDESSENQPWRCLFCRMHTGVRLFRIPVCHICRDQVQDFVWVSGIQAALIAVGFISGVQFAIEEILLFGVLVIVKHRLPSIFDRFTQSA